MDLLSTPLVPCSRRRARRLMRCAVAIGLSTVVRLQPAVGWGYDWGYDYDDVRPPAVPANLQVPPGNEAFLVGHATGTQGYMCVRNDSGFAWMFFGPQATLFNDLDRQIVTHFLSPNPDENGSLRASWEHSRDSSEVWAKMYTNGSATVDPTAIPWLLLQVVGARTGPTGGHQLTDATFIQRVHTTGGLAPSTGCAQTGDVGARALVPYTADYYFYEANDDDQEVGPSLFGHH